MVGRVRGVARPLHLALTSLCLCLLWSGLGAADVTPPQPGETRLIGGQALRYLGEQEGQRRWLYPHLDGVPEVFAEGPGLWRGSLGSRFDPQRGSFARRFGAAEVLNELAGGKTSTSGRRRAARLIALFRALHPAGPEGPDYLAPLRPNLARHLDAEGRAWVEAQRAELERIVPKRPWTRVLDPIAPLRSPRDHYRALIADGYLDVVVVAGNSLDRESGERYAAPILAGFRRELLRLGFRPQQERDSEAHSLYERSVTLAGQRVRVRLRVAGGSKSAPEVRRAVVAFVEGFAQADVVLFVGHSNKDTGSYYLSEGKTRYSRFRLGKGAPDLGVRFYGLGRKRHQVVSLQSCSSYPKYCLPVRAHYERDRVSVPGFLGTPTPSYFQEFVPRTTTLIRCLLQGKGPGQLARELNAIKPRELTPLLLIRGVLQPRHAFLVPQGVTLTKLRELGPEEGYRVQARGSDGLDYTDSGIFPQDRVGEVVQVVTWRHGTWGLSRSGELAWIGPETGGGVSYPAVTRHLRATFLAKVELLGRPRLLALDQRGRVVQIEGDGSGFRIAKTQPPPGVRFVALGPSRGVPLAAHDRKGRAWDWTRAGWRRAPQARPLEVTPSLLGHGVPGRLVHEVR